MKSTTLSAVPYDQDFYDSIEPGALRSANVMVPIITNLLRPTSVLDVGCGRGAWAREFLDSGVSRVLGVDGDYVDRSRLCFPSEYFRAIDLRNPQSDLGRFDLAICLEVGEHLPAECAESLVSTLVNASEFVIFSAAIPGQGGNNHVNEQWPTYWQALFAAHGYTAVDLIGPRIRSNRVIEWWYRQNVLLFESGAARDRHPEWNEFRPKSGEPPLEWVYVDIASRPDSVFSAAKRLQRAIMTAISWRWARVLKIVRFPQALRPSEPQRHNLK